MLVLQNTMGGLSSTYSAGATMDTESEETMPGVSRKSAPFDPRGSADRYTQLRLTNSILFCGAGFWLLLCERHRAGHPGAAEAQRTGAVCRHRCAPWGWG